MSTANEGKRGVDGSMVSLQDNPTQGASKTDAPLISTIIPLFNCEKYVGAAIDSILMQNYHPMQIIVVDDGSTDGSAAVARSFSQVEYYSQENAGVAAALNHGLSKAKGEFIAFLDSDEGRLKLELDAFARDPNLDMVMGNVEQFRETGPDTPPVSLGIFQGYLKITVLVRRSALDRVGLFDPQWKTGDFIDWYIRATEIPLKMAMLPDVVARRRIHETNMGIRQRDARSEYARIMRLALERRRKAKS
jgi:glycosyltransferase involved in cell wall biosynthesis